MIEIIGSYESVTTTKLAQIQGITKGAVSQTTTKLLNKELIIKEFSKEKTNEVFISLSIKGKVIFENHRAKHEDLIVKIDTLVEELPSESIHNEVMEIAKYLLKHNINCVKMIYGQQMGTEIGMELLRQLLDKNIDVEYEVFKTVC